MLLIRLEREQSIIFAVENIYYIYERDLYYYWVDIAKWSFCHV